MEFSRMPIHRSLVERERADVRKSVPGDAALYGGTAVIYIYIYGCREG